MRGRDQSQPPIGERDPADADADCPLCVRTQGGRDGDSVPTRSLSGGGSSPPAIADEVLLGVS